MWEFMKRKTSLPVCPNKPPHEAIKELEAYRAYVLKSINAVYEKILEELSVTDPKSLEKLNEVIGEYREVEAAIDTKLTKLETMVNSFLETYKASGVEDLRLYYDYNPVTKNLTYRIGKKEGK